MNNMPIITFQLEGLKQRVSHCFADHNDELAKAVEECLEKTLTRTWVTEAIQSAVDVAVRTAVAEVANNYKLRMAIEGAVGDVLADLINKKPATNQRD
jgi:transcriptional/translational regulatory protein YebC/TACO1